MACWDGAVHGASLELPKDSTVWLGLGRSNNEVLGQQRAVHTGTQIYGHFFRPEKGLVSSALPASLFPFSVLPTCLYSDPLACGRRITHPSLLTFLCLSFHICQTGK